VKGEHELYGDSSSFRNGQFGVHLPSFVRARTSSSVGKCATGNNYKQVSVWVRVSGRGTA